MVHWVIVLGSVAVYFVVTLAYTAICVTCSAPSNPYWVLQNQMADPMFYLVCILATVVALLPRYVQHHPPRLPRRRRVRKLAHQYNFTANITKILLYLLFFKM